MRRRRAGSTARVIGRDRTEVLRPWNRLVAHFGGRKLQPRSQGLRCLKTEPDPMILLVHATRLRILPAASATAVAFAAATVFFYAPEDADQGLLQRIFYLHVPMAIVALCGFIAGGVFAIKHLRTRDRAWDLRSYIAIHLSLILGVGVLVTGSIWARAAWGHWWVWDEPTLVSFLVVFLLFTCCQPLRFSIEDPERQARYASVFAVTGAAFVPLNFLAVRLAQGYVHPRVLTSSHNMTGAMRLTFYVALAAMVLLYVTMFRVEIAAKRDAIRLRRARRALEAAEAAA